MGKNLPCEVLSKIFQNLNTKEQAECQKVCWSWYFPAHVLLLNEIRLKNAASIASFIACIDHNPEPSYLNAIQKITLCDVDKTRPVFDKETTEKLFCRFPNLQRVWIYASLASFEGFDDAVCKMIAASCPQLDVFQVRSYEDPMPQDVWYRLRFLVTAIYLDTLGSNRVLEQPAQFLACFPRLRHIRNNFGYLDNFEQAFPVFERLAHLRSISFLVPGEDVEGFAESYLAQKACSKDRDILLSRFSGLTQLDVCFEKGFCVNMMKFAAKYLTGLKHFVFTSRTNRSWTNAQQELLCNVILDFALSTKSTAHVYLGNMVIENFPSALFSTITNKVFQTSSAKNVLELRLQDDDGYYGTVVHIALDLQQQPSLQRKMTVTHSNPIIHSINLFKSSSVLEADMDVFILSFSKGGWHPHRTINVTTYDRFLEGMTSLKEVILEIPYQYDDTTKPAQYALQGAIYPLVEDATLQVTKELEFQILLDRFSFAFPHLKRLNIHYSCGIWREHAKEYQLYLTEYSLERLTLDITPLRTRMEEHFKKMCLPIRDLYYIINLEIRNSKKRRVYKAPFNLLTITRIDGDALRAFNQCKYYMQLCIVVNSLHKLELCVSSNIFFTHKNTTYLNQENRQYVTWAHVFTEDE